jgi:hypothetical protein
LPRSGADEADTDEAPIGQLFGRLIDDGKAYAKAEIGLVRARAEDQADRAKLPAILGGASFAFALAAVIALVMTLVLTLASMLGPLLGGLLATAIAAAIAGGLAYGALQSWKRGS